MSRNTVYTDFVGGNGGKMQFCLSSITWLKKAIFSCPTNLLSWSCMEKYFSPYLEDFSWPLHSCGNSPKKVRKRFVKQGKWDYPCGGGHFKLCVYFERDKLLAVKNNRSQWCRYRLAICSRPDEPFYSNSNVCLSMNGDDSSLRNSKKDPFLRIVNGFSTSFL